MKLYFCAIWLFVVLPIYGQPAFSHEIAMSYTTEVKDMAIDSIGFLWLGTQNGVVLYNGYEEIHIALPKGSEKVSRLSLFDGGILVGTQSGTVYVVDLVEKNITGVWPPFSKSPISDFLMVRGIVYVATYGDGVFKTKDFKHFEKMTNLLSNEVYDLEWIPSIGSLSIASDKGINLVDHKNPKKNKIVAGLPDYIIVDQCISSKGDLVACTYNHSVFTYDPVHEKISIVYDNPEAIKNQKIICSGGKLLLLAGNAIMEITEGKAIPMMGQDQNEKMTCMVIDEENNLWASKGKNKLVRLNLFLQHCKIHSEDGIQSLLYHQDMTYVGTEKALYIYKEGNSKPIFTMLQGNSITTIKNFHGLIWLGTLSNGLYTLNPSNNKLQHVEKLTGENDNTVLDIEMTDDEHVQVATLAGVKTIDADLAKYKHNTDHRNLTIKAYVYDIFKDSKNRLWYGKDRNGITLIEGEKSTDFKTITINKRKLKVGSVYSIVEGRPGEILFSTTGAGLIRFFDHQWQQLINTNSPADPYTTMAKISDDKIFLLRQEAIEILDLSDQHILPIYKSPESQNKNIYFNNYAIGKKEIYFGIDNYVLKFTDHVRKFKKHPNTAIEIISNNLEKITRHTNRFSEDQNNLQFHFTAGWLSDPSSIQYAYRLEGFDEDWRITRDREVSYPHLAPGQYTFKVRASENNTFSDEPADSYSFEIHQAWYNTWWFYTLSALGIISLIVWQQRRQKNLALLKSELSRKVMESELFSLKKQLDPHFLFNTLNTLIGLIEIDPNKGILYTEQLTDFFRNLSNASNKELIPLKDEVEIIELYKEIVGQRFGSNLIIEIESSVRSADPILMLPPLSIQMLIENAIKHNEVSKAKPLTVSISLNQNQIIVKNIKNPKLTKEKSLGIGNKNIVERYKLLTNQVPKIEDLETSYTFYLPLIKNKIL